MSMQWHPDPVELGGVLVVDIGGRELAVNVDVEPGPWLVLQWGGVRWRVRGGEA